MDNENGVDQTAAWARLIALGFALVLVGIATATFAAMSIRSAIDDNADSGWMGIAAFIVLYAIATILLVPGSVSTVTAGLVYGTVTGALVSVIGATIGATLAYGIARGVGRGPAEAVLAHRVRQIDDFVAERQFRSMVILRLLPVVPFNVFNYAAGLSPIRSRPYVAGTLIGIIPGSLLVAGLGESGRHPTSPTFIAMVALTVAAALASILVARR